MINVSTRKKCIWRNSCYNNQLIVDNNVQSAPCGRCRSVSGQSRRNAARPRAVCRQECLILHAPPPALAQTCILKQFLTELLSTRLAVATAHWVLAVRVRTQAGNTLCTNCLSIVESGDPSDTCLSLYF